MIVIAHDGRTDVAGWGGILSKGAVRNGVEGIVIDTQKFSRRMSLSEDERKAARTLFNYSLSYLFIVFFAFMTDNLLARFGGVFA